MDSVDIAVWKLVENFLSDPSLWGEKTFVAKADRLVGWTVDDFDLSIPAPNDAAALRMVARRWASISRFANIIPSSVGVTPGGHLLSDLVRNIFSEGDCASSVKLSEEERKKYENARRVLFVNGPSGASEVSEASKAYTIYKAKYLAAEQSLRKADLEAKNSNDVKFVDNFHEIDRPILVDAVENAKIQWVALGKKNEIESAKAIVLGFSEQQPIETWSRFRDQFSIAELKDIDGGDFFPVRVVPDSPDNLIWQLASVQIPIDEKYKPLSSSFQKNSISPLVNYDRIEFEFAFLRIEREWLENSNSILTSGFWRHRTLENGYISNGKIPRSGLCPGFTIGFILVRSLNIFSSHTITKISGGKDVSIPNEFHDIVLKSSLNEDGIFSNPSTSMNKSFGKSIAGKGGLSKFQDLTPPVSLASFSKELGGVVKVDVAKDSVFSPTTTPEFAFEEKIWSAKEFSTPRSLGLKIKNDDEAPSDESLEEIIKRLKLQQIPISPSPQIFESQPAIATTTTKSTHNLLGKDKIVLGGMLCKQLPMMPSPGPNWIWD